MAYQLNPEDELNQNPLNPTSSTGSGVLTAGTEAGSAPDQKVQQGTGWTNLDQYLDVNKGQATGLATDLTKDVNSKVDSFKATDSSSAVAEINKQAGDDAAKSITSNVAANAPAAKTFLGQQVNVNPNDYTAGVRAQGGQLKDNLSQVDNQQFQQGQLQKIYGQKQPYTSGFAALDSFLLFGDQDSKGKLQQVKARTGEVDSTIGRFGGEIDSAIGGAKAQLAKNQGAVRDAAKGQYNTILGGANSRVDPAKTAAKTAAETRAAQIFGKKKGEFAGFINDGADGDQGNNFVKTNDKFGVNNVLTDDEVANLNSLAGIDNGLGLGTVTKDDSQAVTLDEAGWESLLNTMGSSRKSKKEADDKAAAEEAERLKQVAAEAERLRLEEIDRKRGEDLQKILDDNARIERMKAAGIERDRVRGGLRDSYSKPDDTTVDDSFWK